MQYEPPRFHYLTVHFHKYSGADRSYRSARYGFGRTGLAPAGSHQQVSLPPLADSSPHSTLIPSAIEVVAQAHAIKPRLSIPFDDGSEQQQIAKSTGRVQLVEYI